MHPAESKRKNAIIAVAVLGAGSKGSDLRAVSAAVGNKEWWGYEYRLQVSPQKVQN